MSQYFKIYCHLKINITTVLNAAYILSFIHLITIRFALTRPSSGVHNLAEIVALSCYHDAYERAVICNFKNFEAFKFGGHTYVQKAEILVRQNAKRQHFISVFYSVF
jgi:hypothetical protein